MAKKSNQRVVIVGEGLGVLNGLVAEVSHDENDGLRDHVGSPFFSRQTTLLNHQNLLPPPLTRPKMSVQLNPPNALGFRRPLTTLVKRSLTITNHNSQPVAFKVKTTAPKLYCVRPNSGRVEPGESVDVSVMLQALKEEPPLSAKCKDKFLIQSTVITPDKENLALNELWASPELSEEGKVHQQKLRVTYLPAEGESIPEVEEKPDVGVAGVDPAPAPEQANPPNPLHLNGSPYATVRQHPANSHSFTNIPDDQDYRSHSPAPGTITLQNSSESEATEQHNADYEEHYERASGPSAHVYDEPPAPSTAPAPPVAAPEPIYITRENPINEELYAKYNLAQAEIDRLKAQIAELATPAPSELRRRTRKLSETDSVAGSDFQTVIEDMPLHHQEGVPLQVVVIVALGVFVTTYLFF